MAVAFGCYAWLTISAASAGAGGGYVALRQAGRARAGRRRRRGGLPLTLVSDNGTELTGMAILGWSQRRSVDGNRDSIFDWREEEAQVRTDTDTDTAAGAPARPTSSSSLRLIGYSAVCIMPVLDQLLCLRNRGSRTLAVESPFVPQ